MSNVWIYKVDGTVQCDNEVPEISLSEMREKLELLIGADNVVSMKKSQRPMFELCGAPTGKLNCYEITPHGWILLSTKIPGSSGFQRMDHGPAESAESVNLGRVMGSLTAFNPHSIQDLLGHSLRVYESGVALTLDWRPERCNIETDGDQKIVKVWFG